MKNRINNTKKVFLMVALIATVMGYANDRSFLITKKDDNKTVLTLDDVKEGNLFTIKDENGITLYKETIKQTGVYTKGFDLTLLPDGSYFFELEKDFEVTTIPFTVTANEVTFNKEQAETMYKPSTRVKNGIIFINQLSLDKSPLKIEVYYNHGAFNEGYQLIHSETVTDTKIIERAFKVENYIKGDYKIVYKTEGRTFVEII